MMKKEHLGGDFDSFLEAEGILTEATAVAVERVFVWRIENETNSNYRKASYYFARTIKH